MSKIRSMTAFARVEDQSEFATLTWEIKSVNHRYLDTSIRLPEKLRHLETQFRNHLRKSLDRGKLEIGLRVEEQNTEQGVLEVDEALVKQLAQASGRIESILIVSHPVSAADIMRWPGVIGVAKVDNDKVEELALTSFDKLLKQFIENREREGAQLQEMISQRLEKIDGFIKIFRKNLPETLKTHRKKLQTRLESILEKNSDQVDQDRLEQELVIFAQKIDIEEELDRLEAHCKEVNRVLKKGGAAGRQLDFLMQELNREANTTGSKSASAEQSQAVVDLKVCIEQMREQIQNIE
jgi:uncharacterized protein (TIGR00255 family)